MPYDEELADRVRAVIAGRATERKMFGRLMFLVGGNLACGVAADGLMVRLSPEDAEAALAEPGATPAFMRDRPMTGWVLVARSGLPDEESLRRWTGPGLALAGSLPAK